MHPVCSFTFLFLFFPPICLLLVFFCFVLFLYNFLCRQICCSFVDFSEEICFGSVIVFGYFCCHLFLYGFIFFYYFFINNFLHSVPKNVCFL